MYKIEIPCRDTGKIGEEKFKKREKGVDDFSKPCYYQ